MRRAGLMLALFAIAVLAHAETQPSNVLAQGARDGSVPAWAIATDAPTGWTRDCCMYAKAIGVDAVLYQGDWTGKPQRVMVLNVWPRKLPTLEAELQADRKHYLQTDPAAKVTDVPVHHPTMSCEATVYQGADHVDDMVVFCDPGQVTDIRLSWSMTFDDADPSRRVLLDNFMQVVMASRYTHAEVLPKVTAPPHAA